jgi:hypothetical protein
MKTKMSIEKHLGTTVLSVALLLACAVPALAETSQRVTFAHDFALNGTTLQAGKCIVRWKTHSPEATVEFVRHNKVVLSTEGRVEKRSKAYDRDAVVYDTGADGTFSLLEIRSAYSDKVLVFDQNDLTQKASR